MCWWCQLSYHIQIILIHTVTWILAFSLYLDIVYKYELERLLPIISWEKISINHLAFDFNNIDIWSDIWMFTLGWNLTKSAFGLSIEFRPPTSYHLSQKGLEVVKADQIVDRYDSWWSNLVKLHYCEVFVTDHQMDGSSRPNSKTIIFQIHSNIQNQYHFFNQNFWNCKIQNLNPF